MFRLLELGIEPFLIVFTMIGISTSAWSGVSAAMRTTSKPSKRHAIFKEEGEDLSTTLYTQGQAAISAPIRYQGRTGLFEIMMVSDNIDNNPDK